MFVGETGTLVSQTRNVCQPGAKVPGGQPEGRGIRGGTAKARRMSVAATTQGERAAT